MDLNPTDLIHAAPEIRDIVGLLVGGVPIAEIVKRIVLPSADALGERLKHRVERCFEKTGNMVQDAGFAPQSVSDKLIVEVLQGASLEENEDLHTMWAALLANAASPDGAAKVRPGFVAILRRMAPDEATLLKAVADVTGGHNATLPPIKAPTKALLDRAVAAHYALQMVRIREIFGRDGEDETSNESRWQTCVGILESAGLIDVAGDNITLSALGGAFLEACHPPKTTT